MHHQNHLYVWDDRFLYITAGMASDLTQRHTVTLLIALDPPGFVLGDGNGARQRYQAALVSRYDHWKHQGASLSPSKERARRAKRRSEGEPKGNSLRGRPGFGIGMSRIWDR